MAPTHDRGAGKIWPGHNRKTSVPRHVGRGAGQVLGYCGSVAERRAATGEGSGDGHRPSAGIGDPAKRLAPMCRGGVTVSYGRGVEGAIEQSGSLGGDASP
jgi:hypothetical protein